MVVWEYAQLFVVVALASVCQNLTGFAFGLIFVGVAGALQLMPIADAANVACLLSLVNGAVYLRSHPFEPRWDVLQPLAITSLLGTLLGLALLHWLSGSALGVLRMILGAAIVLCAVVLLLQKAQRTAPSPWPSTWLAGGLAGVLGGLFSTSGPPLVYHLYRQPLSPLVVRQSLLALFLMGNVLRLGGHRHGRAGLVLGAGQCGGPARGGRRDLAGGPASAAAAAAGPAVAGVRLADAGRCQPAVGLNPGAQGHSGAVPSVA
ncbi:TSUP family transporter [Comamonas aquatica]|uniref:TSUP family transporter n=1 Tax=Comamonas aquatica TaxID=225991 RepID=UPI001B384736|nr:TSUP family transporter [Comamonas aquatica]QTX20472.1 TSUP family transporter [Comamonas aquatica]